MTPVLDVSRRATMHASDELRLASTIVLAAAEALADESPDSREASRYLLIADRLSALLESETTPRHLFLDASPALVEFSGRHRTLIEMIKSEPGDYTEKLRLAKLLFRALVWNPESFPYPKN